MRAISAKPGEPLVSLSPDDLTKLRGDAHAVYWDYSKGPSPREFCVRKHMPMDCLWHGGNWIAIRD